MVDDVLRIAVCAFHQSENNLNLEFRK
jgi:hypothetical protein